MTIGTKNPRLGRSVSGMIIGAIVGMAALMSLGLSIRERPAGKHSSVILPDWSITVSRDGRYEMLWDGSRHLLARWTKHATSSGRSGEVLDPVVSSVARFSTSGDWIAVEKHDGTITFVDTLSNYKYGPFAGHEVPNAIARLHNETQQLLRNNLQRPQRSHRFTYMSIGILLLTCAGGMIWIALRSPRDPPGGSE